MLNVPILHPGISIFFSSTPFAVNTQDRLAFLARLIEESQAAAEAKYKEREKREN